MAAPSAEPLVSPARQFVAAQIGGLLVPIAAGIIVFGWRAVVCLVLVTIGALAGWAVWRQVGRRGHQLHLMHTLWLALLLGAMLPAHLAARHVAQPDGLVPYSLWPALPAAGLLVAFLNWLLGGTAGGRVNPSLVTLLLLFVLLGEALLPRLVLRREVAVTGDLLDYRREILAELAVRPWAERSAPDATPAIWQVPAAERLTFFTTGLDQPEYRQFTLQSLIRDRMPPMEDLIVMGQPAPIGMASATAIITGGLFLIFRGIADARIPVLTILAAYATLLLAPVPAAITRDGPIWTWVAFLRPQVGWDVALTFVHYELLAGPILFIAFFLAPLPSLRPLTVRWRIAYALILGPLLALSQLYGSVAHGPFVALLAVSLLTPWIDRRARARTLV